MQSLANTAFYDGSFNGFLTLLYFSGFEGRPIEQIQRVPKEQKALFMEYNAIWPDLGKAQLVWEALRSKNYSALKTVYFAFLSEHSGIDEVLFQYALKTLGKLPLSITLDTDLFNKIEKLAKMVEREKRSLELQLHVTPHDEGPSLEIIKPEYNILPLISRYFRTRYKGFDWIIYDAKRNYGIHQQNESVSFIVLEPEALNVSFSGDTNNEKRTVNSLGHLPFKRGRETINTLNQAVA